jgi:hypothetical protein
MNLLLTAFIMAALNVGGVYAGIYHFKFDYLPFLGFMLAYYIIIAVIQKLVMSTFKPPRDMTGPEALHLFTSLLGDVGILLIGNIVALAIVYNKFGFLKMLGFFATGYVSGVISRAM